MREMRVFKRTIPGKKPRPAHSRGTLAHILRKTSRTNSTFVFSQRTSQQLKKTKELFFAIATTN